MLDPALDEVTRERARATGIDWRIAWIGLDDGGQVRAWPSGVAAQVGALECDPGPALVLATPLEPMRALPAHGAEMVSEVRAGERLEGIMRRGAWWLVTGEDGYVGWVHEWVLVEAGDDAAPCDWLYGRPLGTLWTSDHHAATPLVLGTPLWKVGGPLPERGGFHLVATATGQEGWIPEAEIRPAVGQLEIRDALNLLRSLIGTPYRWGGRSPMGFDCSGLVQFVAGLCGARLPRDASQQARTGEEIAPRPEAWEPGDLLFFGDPADHVGFTDGKGRLLHCQGRVRQERIEDRQDLMARLSGVRRWWGLRDPRGSGAWSFRDQ